MALLITKERLYISFMYSQEANYTKALGMICKNV